MLLNISILLRILRLLSCQWLLVLPQLLQFVWHRSIISEVTLAIYLILTSHWGTFVLTTTAVTLVGRWELLVCKRSISYCIVIHACGWVAAVKSAISV